MQQTSATHLSTNLAYPDTFAALVRMQGYTVSTTAGTPDEGENPEFLMRKTARSVRANWRCKVPRNRRNLASVEFVAFFHVGFQGGFNRC